MQMLDRSLEVLRLPSNSRHSKETLDGIIEAAKKDGWTVTVTNDYRRRGSVLVVYGVGSTINNAARNAQIARGGRVVMFDLGYFGKKKTGGYFKVSLDTDHPPQYLDITPNHPERWAAHGIELQEVAGDGPIVLVGLGPKARRYMRLDHWEANQLRDLRIRFPGREVIHRAKPGKPVLDIGIRCDCETPIAELLKGASLVVCRHSNVAVDAAIAGVPFECIDGAAKWLADRPFTHENRLDFLRRCAYWQWRADESAQCWKFITGIIDAT
jgi:hypothetical protein